MELKQTTKKKKYFNEYYSYENELKSKLDEIQSSILNIKLKQVNSFIIKRRKLASIYLKELKNSGLKMPKENDNCYHVYNTFTVYHKKRGLIINHLKKNKIQTRIIYPYPIHKMKGYEKIDRIKDLYNTEKFAKGIFCLPLYPELKLNEAMKICKLINNYL